MMMMAGMGMLQVKPKEVSGHSSLGLVPSVGYAMVPHRQGHAAPLQGDLFEAMISSTKQLFLMLGL